MAFQLLKSGLEIDIQRSDGRIHTAVVSGVDENAKSATVEWYEKGETKGKEVDFEAIFQLNPTVRLVVEAPPQVSGGHGDDQPAASRRKNRPAAVTQEPSAKPSGGGRVTSARRVPSAMATGIKQPLAPSIPTTNQPSSSNILMQQVSSDFESQKPGDRKSNCLKGIEEIHKKREARRAADLIKKTQDALNFDKSMPNWEFYKMILEYTSKIDIQPIDLSDPVMDHQICVAVRKRPLNKKEQTRKEIDVVTIPNGENVLVHQPKTNVDLTKQLDNQQFRFDYCFDESATNEMVYWFTARPLVKCLFDGGMATCFAYGQTGSGKTHTMGGDFQSKGVQDCTKGIYALASADVFNFRSLPQYQNAELTVCCSFFEIYSGKVFDLLNNKEKLRVLEDARGVVQVVGLTEEIVDCVDDVLERIRAGNVVRTSGTTSANQHSSRSHAVFQIILRRGRAQKLYGKFSLIDLAGNERGADTISADRQTRLEGAEINKSLLALKECIRALGRKNVQHLPFRVSKLTQVLRDSFIGENSKTCMIAAITPCMSSCEHTLNTLRYSDRVKELGPGSDQEAAPIMYLPDTNGVPPSRPANGKPTANNGMSPQNTDLRMLRTGNEGELDDDMMAIHEVVNQCQEAEEECLDENKAFIDKLKSVTSQMNSLLLMANKVDYDQMHYLRSTKELLSQTTSAMQNFQVCIKHFEDEVKREQDVSMEMTTRRKTGGNHNNNGAAHHKSGIPKKR